MDEGSEFFDCKRAESLKNGFSETERIRFPTVCPLKILLHGLNYSPEEIGIGKYSGEMIQELAARGCDCLVVTTPPYYPHWKIAKGFRGWWYQRLEPPSGAQIERAAGGRQQDVGDRRVGSRLTRVFGRGNHEQANSDGLRALPAVGRVSGGRCPLWVPRKVSGLKRIVHLASFGISSFPAVLWMAIRHRPDVIITVEPAAFCMPTTWLASRLCGAKAWLHVQDFEVDAAFELGILKQPLLKKWVLATEAFFMRRFDRVSSISINMVQRLQNKGVSQERTRLFPNWVDCDSMRPLEKPERLRAQFGLPEHCCIALYAGNIGAKQGLDLIVEAAKQSAKKNDVQFVICGDGAARSMLEQQATGLDNLTLLPVQPFSQFNELMNCADIHLLPQKGDAADLVMPSKLTGMLATGRPVVACASPGTQIAAVVEGHGLVVPPGVVDAFAQAICRLAGDQTLRNSLGRQARIYAEEHLSRTAIIDTFFDELKVLIPK